MFNIFKSKTAEQKLQTKYEKLIAKWHKLSTIDRIESDKAYAEAQDILNQIELAKK